MKCFRLIFLFLLALPSESIARGLKGTKGKGKGKKGEPKKGTKKKGSTEQNEAPSAAPSASPSASPTASSCEPCTGGKFNDTTIYTAVDAWCDDATNAITSYGSITTWCVGDVTSMEGLFWKSQSPLQPNRADFNDDIGCWDVSSVTTMYRMFQAASKYNLI